MQQEFGSKQLDIRLQTQELLRKIELFLRGKRQVERHNDSGQTIIEDLVYGKPMANEIGVQALMSQLETKINPHTVQGNFPKESYYHNFIQELNESLVTNIIINRKEWGIAINMVNYIVDTIIEMSQPFFTRLLFNKERESYTDTIRSVETNTLRESQDGMMSRIFKRG